MKVSLKSTFKYLKDVFHILRLKLFPHNPSSEGVIKICGVPVENLGSLVLNKEIVEKLERKWGGLHQDFSLLIGLTAEALKAVGKYFDTDSYLERKLLDGAKEREAHRHFLVERREVDRAMLMMTFDRDKIDKLETQSSTSKQWEVSLQRSRRKRTGSVLDESYDLLAIQQAEDYFNLLFQENSIIHLLNNSKKIVKILRLPYELPAQLYKREPYTDRRSFGLTELILSGILQNEEISSQIN
ncbi:hypothetical protein WDW89_05740 [Deltaproteobacteria bacterium TL4]